MPFITDTQLARVQGAMATMQSKAMKAKEKAQEKAGEMKQTLETVGAAGALCFIRGKMEADDGSWVVPGTTIDIELAVALGILGAGFFDLFGKYDEDVLNAGNGILAHYTGQVFRKFGKTGSLSLVAGIGNELPQLNPVSYNPTQMSAPFADPVASALASSGV